MRSLDECAETEGDIENGGDGDDSRGETRGGSPLGEETCRRAEGAPDLPSQRRSRTGRACR